MSNLISGQNKICGEIVNALGLSADRVKKLDLHMAVDSIVTMEIEMYPEEEGMKNLIPIVKKFVLTESK